MVVSQRVHKGGIGLFLVLQPSSVKMFVVWTYTLLVRVRYSPKTSYGLLLHKMVVHVQWRV